MSLKYAIGFIFFGLLLVATTGTAQTQNPQQLRESDLVYSKRIWRVIELREKQNKVAMWPRNPLVKVLYDATLAGKIRPYKNDSLQSFFDVEQFARIGCDTFQVKRLLNPDEDDLFKIDTVVETFNPEVRIKQLLLLEEVYFDGRTGQQRTQIIAIAPLYQRQINGIDLGFIPLCWFTYYSTKTPTQDVRNLLAQSYMYNNGNPYQKFSYYHWFEQHLFHSFIIKESNPHDIFLMDDPEVKKNGLEALIKAAYLKQLNAEQEQDMYEY